MEMFAGCERLQKLEDAINKVLFTKYKKDAKEAHLLVESYGFEIYKYDGWFGIRHPKTHKVLRLEDNYRYRAKAWVKLSSPNKEITQEEVSNHKLNMNILDYLNKPFNVDWGYVKDRDACDDGSSGSAYHPTWEKRWALRDARWNVEFHKQKIEDYNEKIDALMEEIKETQKDLIRNVEDVAKYETKLDNLRKELGLKKGA